ncbi:heterokaryon incompatibility protein 6, OR allele [Colletotrichum spaethianum]|uniref:Heterokaryon incompatibility protein 6, OR allele n=1 Tax=Colletotrichum spaethianum TaxID=700344 RepID=A0AA37L1G8_9PEZI|nr:heterokaryon incompatibility protein 6, OR allele [Colletotrichum spaethianum]GKT40226.1 heterokaryon incompatibility protein 6, OR allele [Colletotrichum spaethianum]
MSQPRRPTEEALDDSDGYELQIALDQLSAGSTEALKLYLARKNGLDPTTVSLRTTPWEAKIDGATNLSYAGKLDNTRAPDDENGPMIDEAWEPPHVVLEDTEIPFNYVPLDPELRQFRLLKLAPPDEHGIIRHLQLETFSLDDAPSYFCLSYVWGDPERFLEVNCNGQMILVTQNLFHAVQTCFNRHPKSWLWADGVCVNQEDIAERSQQVLLMGNIYQEAAMILAHPGHYSYGRTESEEQDIAMTVLKDRLEGLGMQDMMSFGDEIPVEGNVPTNAENPSDLANFTLGPVDDAYDPKNVQGAISIMTYLTRIWDDQRRDKVMSDLQWKETSLPDPHTESGREVWENLVRFWTTDWYFRTWVLQEVILGTKVVVLYGSTAISLDAITEFWDLAKHRGLPRPLRIGPYADIFNTILHLSPVGSFKLLRDRQKALARTARNFQKDDVMTSDAKGHDGDNITENLGKDSDDGSLGGAALQSSSLLELLCLTRNNLATDPRDKIYGLLGLTDDAVSRTIIPDYSRHNTPAKVFAEVAAQIVEFGHATDLLHHAGIDQDVQGLPSWAPDWTMQSRSRLPVHLYNCLPSTNPTISILKSDGKPKLALRGAILAQINAPGPAWRYYSHDSSLMPFNNFENAPETEIPPFNDEDARNFIFAFLSCAAEGDLERRYSAEGLNNALVRTLAVDCSWQNERLGKRGNSTNADRVQQSSPTVEGSKESATSASPSDEFFAGVDAFRRFYARGPESEEDFEKPGVRVHQTGIFQWLLDFDEETEADLQKRMVPFTAPFQEAQRGRRWAAMGTRGPKTKDDLAQDAEKKKETPSRRFYSTKVLKDYYMGTVPWDAETEDYVVLFEGFRTPFVLRQSKEETANDGGAVFKLVGDCYIHNAMDGQLMAWADDLEGNLDPGQVGVNDEGRKYVVQHPEGYALFEDFIIA